MISLPEALLADLDNRARDRGTTRSGLIRELAERELADGNEIVDSILATAHGHGGDNARSVRESRDSR